MTHNVIDAVPGLGLQGLQEESGECSMKISNQLDQFKFCLRLAYTEIKSKLVKTLEAKGSSIVSHILWESAHFISHQMLEYYF